MCQFYNLARGIKWADQHKGKYTWVDTYSDFLKASIAFEVVSLIMSIVLLVCAALHQAKYRIMALIFVIWSCILLILGVIIVITVCVVARQYWKLVLAIAVAEVFIIALCILCILVVYSYYQQLRDADPEYIGLTDQGKSQDAPPPYQEKV